MDQRSGPTSLLATHAVLRFVTALAACGYVQLVEFGLCFAVVATVDPGAGSPSGILVDLGSWMMEFVSGNSLPSAWLLPIVGISVIGIGLKAGIFVHALHHRARSLHKPLLALAIAVMGVGAGAAASLGHTLWMSTIAAEFGPEALAAVAVANSVTALLRGHAVNVGLIGVVIFLGVQGYPTSAEKH